jgi:hypothetical protein
MCPSYLFTSACRQVKTLVYIYPSITIYYHFSCYTTCSRHKRHQSSLQVVHKSITERKYIFASWTNKSNIIFLFISLNLCNIKASGTITACQIKYFCIFLFIILLKVIKKRKLQFSFLNC